MEFYLSEEDEKKYAEWSKNHNCPITYTGAIGGKTTFQFTPTGLGSIIKVICGCGEELDLTDYESW